VFATVYEQTKVAGGRSTVLDVPDDLELRTELEASIFVELYERDAAVQSHSEALCG